MWMEHVEIVTEALPLAASVEELDGLARDLIDALRISAKDFQVEKTRLLDG